ncbi:ATP-grasp domain-containing protein [Pseudaminobacter soli (ex Zhang et al. 2022)]|uniref:ATP-grasp domain-containing protein n=1 Tax=Pseudaminobacter soli (ex Zhang et al. 2022) TaxID=2831468 RepID=UPI001F01BD89|nr:ATP-grasp domain-containing protein [Pseudaminobacter soli]
MHETSQSSAGLLLIASVSGRALAAAARCAGYRARVADFFCDDDTKALAERTSLLPGDLRAGIDPAAVLDTLRSLADGDEVSAVILGSGFERIPEVVDEIARHLPLAGNRTAAIRRVKDPLTLAEDCAALGIPHPKFRFEPPPDPENWVVKAIGSAGGAHVGRAEKTPIGHGRYFQQLVRGTSLSALFLADGSEARMVGFSRQWTSPSPTAPYRYGGAARLRRLDCADVEMIADRLSGLAEKAGLVGLCSADFICSSEGWCLIEINPRPGATLDIFDSAEAPLMEAHLRACRGEEFILPRFADSMASMIAYAARPVESFPAIVWPEWTADRQPSGTRLMAGDPVCTIFARGPSAASARRRAGALAAKLERHWTGVPT